MSEGESSPAGNGRHEVDEAQRLARHRARVAAQAVTELSTELGESVVGESA
jgi:hypothetical protein